MTGLDFQIKLQLQRQMHKLWKIILPQFKPPPPSPRGVVGSRVLQGRLNINRLKKPSIHLYPYREINQHNKKASV